MNWGFPFVFAFILLISVSASELLSGALEAANATAVYGFYALVIGVVLQIASYVTYGFVHTALHGGMPAIFVIALLLLAAIFVGYPLSFYQWPVSGVFPGQGSASFSVSTSSSSSGCVGPRNDGTIFISTNSNVSIGICGKDFPVNAGTGGGLTYAYHSGRVNFTAPSSLNGSAFEFWYVTLAGGQPERVSSAALSLNLPAGLSSQNSLIALFYAVPPGPAVSTTSSTSTTASSTTSSSPVTSSTTSVTTVTVSSTTTAAPTCAGTDGSIFISTNVNATVPMVICGEQISVPGGSGGGLAYSYHAGMVTFVAPATAKGMTFQYWLVSIPSLHAKVPTSELRLNLPAGYLWNNAAIEAVYG